MPTVIFTKIAHNCFWKLFFRNSTIFYPNFLVCCLIALYLPGIMLILQH